MTRRLRAPARFRWSCWIAGVMMPLAPLAVGAQRANAAAGRPVFEEAPPSRAESLLARGRLRAAEEALYAAVAAAPHAPAARGELGRYLASRARFVVAGVLFAEALRFGADTAAVAQALMAMASYRPEEDRRRIPDVQLPPAERAREEARLGLRASGAEEDSGTATVMFTFARQGGTIGEMEVRGPGGVRRASVDPRVTGLLVRSALDSALTPRRFGASGEGAPLLVPELWIGGRRLPVVEARVDPGVPEGTVRIGLDVLWALNPIFDERRGTLTLPGAAELSVPRGARQIPFMLAFPGLWLVPSPGVAPMPIESAPGRALLRGARWRIDRQQATLVVER